VQLLSGQHGNAISFEVALDKACELKYELERMKVTFSVSDDACTAYFEVVPEPGHLVLGGDLTVKIDLNTKQVIDFERGQWAIKDIPPISIGGT